MNKFLVTVLFMAGLMQALGQQYIQIHHSANLLFSKEITAVDSISLDEMYARFAISGGAGPLAIQKSIIDSLTFSTTSGNPDKIFIIFNGNDNATIINPFANLGVSISAAGGMVTATAASGLNNLEYHLLGSSFNGSLSLSTDKPVRLVLNNLSLTNPNGAALSISGGQATHLILTPGTTNTLSDGAASAKNGTVMATGPLVIENTGSLVLTGVKKHGITTTSTLSLLGGTTTILAAASDGLHSEGFTMADGSLSIVSQGDGLDAGDGPVSISGGSLHITSSANDVKALQTGNSNIAITGGEFIITVAGAQSKAISANGNITIDGGNFDLSLSGATVLTALGAGFDPSYCSGIKSGGTLSVNGGIFSIEAQASADGAKGFSSSGDLLITAGQFEFISGGNGGTYTDSLGISASFSVSGFSSDANIHLSGGTFNLTLSGAGGKGFSAGLQVVVSNAADLTITSSGAAGRGIKADGPIVFDGGTTTISLSGAVVLSPSGSGFEPAYPTGVKSAVDVVVNGGTVQVDASATATGARCLASGRFMHLNGGNLILNTAGAGATYMNAAGLPDSYSSAALSADSSIQVSGGTLTIQTTGSDSKGISADGDVVISGVPQMTITNSGASGKAIKAGGNMLVDGGILGIQVSGATTLVPAGSGSIPSYPCGLKATGTLTINGGTLTIQGTAQASGVKGLMADGNIAITGGSLSVTTAGNGAVYTNSSGITDSYSPAAISTDANLSISGGTLSTTCSGSGAKGLKADGTIAIGTATSSPSLTITTTGARFVVTGSGTNADYCHPKTIVAVGAVSIQNGTLTINSSDDGIHSDASVTISGGTILLNANSTATGMGEGVEAPLIYFTGGVTNITSSNDGINATYGTVAGGTESNDGSHLYISGGIVIVAGKDGIDSNGNITITGGTTIVCGVTTSPEEALDFNGSFNMNGGYIICAGSNSNMTKNFSSTSTQRTMYLKSGSQLATTSLFHIRNASGTEMVTFKPKNGVYYFHFSSPSVAPGTSYQVYFGGTYTGGSFVGNASGWGLYTGGTYSTTGGTLKSTFTSSFSSTLNTVTF